MQLGDKGKQRPDVGAVPWEEWLAQLRPVNPRPLVAELLRMLPGRHNEGYRTPCRLYYFWCPRTVDKLILYELLNVEHEQDRAELRRF